MVNFTIFLKEKLGITGESVVRYALSWAAWGLCQLGYDENYFFMTAGPINPFNLTAAGVSDKINLLKADEFIEICQKNPQHEIGTTTNRWFLEAYQACQKIWGLTLKHFEGIDLFVHVPGNDKIVYPDWVVSFFEQNLTKSYKLFFYPDEEHNLVWASDGVIRNFIGNL